MTHSLFLQQSFMKYLSTLWLCFRKPQMMTVFRELHRNHYSCTVLHLPLLPRFVPKPRQKTSHKFLSCAETQNKTTKSLNNDATIFFRVSSLWKKCTWRGLFAGNNRTLSLRDYALKLNSYNLFGFEFTMYNEIFFKSQILWITDTYFSQGHKQQTALNFTQDSKVQW